MFVLDGAVAVESNRGLTTVEAPAAIGVDEVLRGETFAASVRATEICATLELPHQAFLTLLAEGRPFVRGLFCLALPDVEVDTTPVLRAMSAERTRATTAAIETVLALERIDLFAGAAAADLLALTSRGRTIPVESGALLMSEADPPALLVLLSATATIERPDGSGTTAAAGGDVIGAYGALTERTSRWRVHCASAGTVVRIESADLLQVLGERVTLLQRVFARVARTPSSSLVNVR
jgi:CRP-like cAMP-binding protein